MPQEVGDGSDGARGLRLSPALDPRGCRSGWDQRDRRQQAEGVRGWARTAVLVL